MPLLEPYAPDPNRYDGRMPYRKLGRSGLKLPAAGNYGPALSPATGPGGSNRSYSRRITP